MIEVGRSMAGAIEVVRSLEESYLPMPEAQHARYETG